jgi:hypothetical protein
LAHLAHDANSSPSPANTMPPPLRLLHSRNGAAAEIEALNDAHPPPVVSRPESLSSPPLRAYKKHHNSAASRRAYSRPSPATSSS